MSKQVIKLKDGQNIISKYPFRVTSDFELVVISNICLDPNNCYQVETYLPWYLTAILAGSAYLILKEIF